MVLTLSAPKGHCGPPIWMNPSENGNMTGLWELSLMWKIDSVAGYPLIRLWFLNTCASQTCHNFIVNPPVDFCNRFGHDFNALFQNVCALWSLSKWFWAFVNIVTNSVSWGEYWLTACPGVGWGNGYANVLTGNDFLRCHFPWFSYFRCRHLIED